jgi:hypothetical protein
MDMANLDVNALMKMSQEHLDDLFRASPAGPIPSGEGQGTLLIAPGTALAETAARLIHLLAWQGKVFDPDKRELRNEVLPIGLRAVIAQVYKGPSWFDGRESIVLDYSRTSLIAHWIRDEIREVAPGLYLGIVYWNHAKLINFALTFS